LSFARLDGAHAIEDQAARHTRKSPEYQGAAVLAAARMPVERAHDPA
jgi:hypothetical protein